MYHNINNGKAYIIVSTVALRNSKSDETKVKTKKQNQAARKKRAKYLIVVSSSLSDSNIFLKISKISLRERLLFF